MNTQELHAMLEKLHTELANADTLDEASMRLLQDLRDDIQEVLHQSEEDQTGRYRSIRRRLTEAIEHFEVSHPTLTANMSQVIDGLGQMGI